MQATYMYLCVCGQKHNMQAYCMYLMYALVCVGRLHIYMHGIGLQPRPSLCTMDICRLCVCVDTYVQQIYYVCVWIYNMQATCECHRYILIICRLNCVCVCEQATIARRRENFLLFLFKLLKIFLVFMQLLKMFSDIGFGQNRKFGFLLEFQVFN